MPSYLEELKRRKINIQSYVLVLYSMSMGASTYISYNITYSLVTLPEGDSCLDPVSEADPVAQQIVPILQNFSIIFFFPFLGWLSDVKIGRDRGIRASLWCCWFGIMLQLVSYCIEYGTCGLPASFAKYCISGVALIFLMLGTAGIYIHQHPTIWIGPIDLSFQRTTQSICPLDGLGIVFGFSSNRPFGVCRRNSILS